MPIPESKRRNNDIYNAKCDRISARPIKPIGNAIRAAAKAAAGGRSPSAADQSGGVAVFLAHPRQITAQGRGHGGHFAAAHSLFPL